jgi:hypothetical protein
VARGGKREPREGKKLGRPGKPKIELFATKGIATEVLQMDGQPDHTRKCKCGICAGEQKKECVCTKAADGFKVTCHFCLTRADHLICRCEHCGWWALLVANDRRLAFETRRYLTDRRDGKPAQGMFVGDTREKARELDFGDLPELIAPSKSLSAGKAN